MIYLIKDKHGFVTDVLEVEPDTLNEFEVQELMDKFVKTRHMTSITQFDVTGFQKYLLGVKGVGSRSYPKFNVLNTRV